MGDFSKSGCYHVFMKPDLRISIKGYRRAKILKNLLRKASFSQRQFWACMNGTPRPGKADRSSLPSCWSGCERRWRKRFSREERRAVIPTRDSGAREREATKVFFRSFLRRTGIRNNEAEIEYVGRLGSAQAGEVEVLRIGRVGDPTGNRKLFRGF